MVLICMCLMTNHVELLCIYLLVICTSPSKKCLFKPFAYVLIKLFGFLLLEGAVLHSIPDFEPLSNRWFLKMVSRPVGCLFTLLTVSSDAHKFFILSPIGLVLLLLPGLWVS